MAGYAPGSLLAHLAHLPDPRSRHGRRFSLPALLASACAAVPCGQRSYAAIARWLRHQPDELRRAPGFSRAPPTGGAFRYLFNLIDPSAFEGALSARVAGLVPAEAGQLRPTPPDGKALKGSDDGLRGAVHLLALLDGPTGGVLRQLAVGDKANEHKAAFALLKGVVLGGRALTAGAMFRHRDLAREVRDKGGHYFFEVKDNRQQLKGDIASAFGPAFSPYEARRRLCEDDEAHGTPKRGGRLGQRHPQATTRLNGCLDWPDVGQVCRLERVVRRDGREAREVEYAITSAGPEWAGAETLLSWWRGHWGIENGLHYVRDVTMGEGASRIRTGSAPEVMAGLRNAAITLLRPSGVANLAEALRDNLYRPGDILAKLGIVNL